MSIIRVTREFTFETAHALLNYDGPCRNVHGHSYKLYVTVMGEPVARDDDPKLGMVIDFGVLKKIVNHEIVELFDHTVVISNKTAGGRLADLEKMFENVLVVDYQPTCENMVSDIASRLNSALPSPVALHSLKLFETATSFAEWFSEDNN